MISGPQNAVSPSSTGVLSIVVASQLLAANATVDTLSTTANVKIADKIFFIDMTSLLFGNYFYTFFYILSPPILTKLL